MYAVVVLFKIKAESAARFANLVLANAKLSLDEEPKCHQFDVCFNAEKPEEIFLYELYTDKAAFDTHLASDHFLSFAKKTADMVESKELRLYADVVQY